MGGRKQKISQDKNRRLDVFLKNLEIEQNKRKKIVDYVEKITFNALKPLQEKKLRLNK